MAPAAGTPALFVGIFVALEAFQDVVGAAKACGCSSLGRLMGAYGAAAQKEQCFAGLILGFELLHEQRIEA